MGIVKVFSEENIKKNVILLTFAQLIMIYIFNEYKNLHYHHFMIKGVMEETLKVNLGVESIL